MGLEHTHLLDLWVQLPLLHLAAVLAVVQQRGDLLLSGLHSGVLSCGLLGLEATLRGSVHLLTGAM